MDVVQLLIALGISIQHGHASAHRPAQASDSQSDDSGRVGPSYGRLHALAALLTQLRSAKHPWQSRPENDVVYVSSLDVEAAGKRFHDALSHRPPPPLFQAADRREHGRRNKLQLLPGLPVLGE
eukprot:scaffold153229_cov17-Prasinocladus_malaysianus.AAC.1